MMVPTFARIQFKLPRDRRLNADTNTLPVVRPEMPTAFDLVAQRKEVISKSDTLVVRSAGSSIYEAAEELGQRYQHGWGPERPLESHNWQLRYGSWFLLAESATFVEFNTGSSQVPFSTMHIRILPPEPGLLTSYRSLQYGKRSIRSFR